MQALVPSQQPGQETPSQKQAPLTQRCPGPHGGLLPHPHVPSALQVSVASVAHERHNAPFWPHAQDPPSVGHGPGISGTHADPRQQPLQVAAVQLLHRPPLQVSPVGQLWQVKPLLPHSESTVPLRQLCPSAEQHPRQVPGSHTQDPLVHFCPTSQGTSVPQAHNPVLLQLSERIGSHAAQARPLFPHELRRVASPASGSVAGDSQKPFLQHPLGQETSSQTQPPFVQCWPGGHLGPEPQEQTP